MYRWFMRQFNWFPFLGPIGRRNEIKYCATVESVVRIPLCSDGDFGFAIAVDVRGGDTNIVQGSKIFRDDKFLPGWVFVPNDLLLIDEENIGLMIPIHISHRDAIADFDVGIDFDRAEMGKSRFACAWSREQLQRKKSEERFQAHSLQITLDCRKGKPLISGNGAVSTPFPNMSHLAAFLSEARYSTKSTRSADVMVCSRPAGMIESFSLYPPRNVGLLHAFVTSPPTVFRASSSGVSLTIKPRRIIAVFQFDLPGFGIRRRFRRWDPGSTRKSPLWPALCRFPRGWGRNRHLRR